MKRTARGKKVLSEPRWNCTRAPYQIATFGTLPRVEAIKLKKIEKN